MKNALLQKELENLLGNKCSFSESVRTNYSRGEDIYDPVLPQCVVFPETNDEISKGFDKYPYETSYDCENNFAPITIFDINDMKKYK